MSSASSFFCDCFQKCGPRARPSAQGPSRNCCSRFRPAEIKHAEENLPAIQQFLLTIQSAACFGGKREHVPARNSSVRRVSSGSRVYVSQPGPTARLDSVSVPFCRNSRRTQLPGQLRPQIRVGDSAQSSRNICVDWRERRTLRRKGRDRSRARRARTTRGVGISRGCRWEFGQALSDSRRTRGEKGRFGRSRRRNRRQGEPPRFTRSPRKVLRSAMVGGRRGGAGAYGSTPVGLQSRRSRNEGRPPPPWALLPC